MPKAKTIYDRKINPVVLNLKSKIYDFLIKGFMKETELSVAVRIWQGPLSIEKASTTTGREFTLLNLPFYLVHRIGRELEKIDR